MFSHKKVLSAASLSLAGLLLSTSGCAVFHSIDKNLTKFADALVAREQRRPENVLARQGYLIHEGSVSVPPVTTALVTNVTKQVTFSYTARPDVVNPDTLYLLLFKEFTNVIGGKFYEERQVVYPPGFLRLTNENVSIIYSYTFPSFSEKGSYRYEWRSQEYEEDYQLLMEGLYRHQ